MGDLSTSNRHAGPDLDASARTPDHVVYRAFVNETVLLNLDTGCYHGINPTGGRMLEEVVRSRTLREAAARLAELYERPATEIEADLSAFCADLEERGLLEFAPQMQPDE
ncbi:MAG: PqqD family protein [Gaiellaceae bacterium]